MAGFKNLTAQFEFGTSEIEQVTRLNSLDQMSPAAAAVNMGNNRLYNQAAPLFESDSANAFGYLVAQKIYAPTVDPAYTPITTTTFAAVDTTNLTITFTAISTQTIVEVALPSVAITGAGALILCLVTHSTLTQVSNHAVATSSLTAQPSMTPLLMTGLTVGTAYSVDLAWATTATNASIHIKSVTAGVGAATDYGVAYLNVKAA